jgi:hypothetical protein
MSAPIPIERVLEILASAKIPKKLADAFENREFPAVAGWTVVIFYDCEEFDYVDSLTHPDHGKIDYPFDEYRTEDGNPLYNWGPP